jgi:hypothetical protein
MITQVILETKYPSFLDVNHATEGGRDAVSLVEDDPKHGPFRLDGPGRFTVRDDDVELTNKLVLLHGSEGFDKASATTALHFNRCPITLAVASMTLVAVVELHQSGLGLVGSTFNLSEGLLKTTGIH